jgi:hypothetical protein
VPLCGGLIYCLVGACLEASFVFKTVVHTYFYIASMDVAEVR